MQYLLSPSNYDLTDPESIPNLCMQHLWLVALTMCLSLVIALPLGVLAARSKALSVPLIALADVVYTIPSIALVAFLILFTGLELPTVLIPLVLYTQLALIRNIVAGINSIDPLLLDVGKGVGMSALQLFWRIRLPLALPIMIAGVRVATVTSIGIASLASLVSQGGLGDLIFKNIASGQFDAVVAGAILLTVLAVVVDVLLLGLQEFLNRGRGVFTLGEEALS